MSFWKRVPGWVWALIVGFSVLITLAEAYPWLSIEATEMLDPANQFSEMFQVSNGGYISLTDLDCYCKLNAESSAYKINMDENGWILFRDFAHSLSHGETVTLPCYRALGAPGFQSGAKLDIRITYAFIHMPVGYFRRSQMFHFQSIQGPDGKHHWIFTSPKPT